MRGPLKSLFPNVRLGLVPLLILLVHNVRRIVKTSLMCVVIIMQVLLFLCFIGIGQLQSLGNRSSRLQLNLVWNLSDRPDLTRPIQSIVLIRRNSFIQVVRDYQVS